VCNHFCDSSPRILARSSALSLFEVPPLPAARAMSVSADIFVDLKLLWEGGKEGQRVSRCMLRSRIHRSPAG
jgi:hypothetical protein